VVYSSKAQADNAIKLRHAQAWQCWVMLSGFVICTAAKSYPFHADKVDMSGCVPCAHLQCPVLLLVLVMQ
jgi:hypothetical protein